MLKAVNNQSSPKKSKQGLCLLVACERVGGKEKIKVTSVEMPWVFILKKHRCPILFPHRGSLHSREEDIFHPRARPRPAQMRWHPSVPCVPRSMAMAGTSRCRCSLDVAVPTGGRRRNAGTTERGTDRKKIPHRPVARGSHHEPATTGIIIIVANHHAPRGSDGVTKGIVAFPWTIARLRCTRKLNIKRIESNRSSLGRARGGLTTTTTTTTARMFPSLDGRTRDWTERRTGTGPSTFRSVCPKKGFWFLSPTPSIVPISRFPDPRGRSGE